MSRTYKDKPYKLRYPSNNNWVYTEGYSRRDLPTIKPKLRKQVDTKNHWMTTPSWWHSLVHTRPKRNLFRNYVKKVVRYPLDQIQELLEPVDSNKPHHYYW